MSQELIGILGVGAALGLLIFSGQKDVKGRLLEIQRQVNNLRERMARLEGLFAGYTEGRKPRIEDIVPRPLTK